METLSRVGNHLPRTAPACHRLQPNRSCAAFQRISRLRSTHVRPLIAFMLAISLGACTVPDFLGYPPQSRGNKVDPELLAQLVPGTSSKKDVIALIGTPTSKAAFDDNSWLYIGEVTQPAIGGTQSIGEQQVLVMHFDAGGVLRSIDKRSKDDAASVSVVSRTTPAPGNSTSLIQQLLGNVGRFSPTGETPGGAAPNTTGGVGPGNSF